MNNLRQLLAVVILALALASTAFAGQVECPGVTQPPPDEATAISEAQSEVQETEADTIAPTMLVLLLVVLPVV